jgi:hypothetical protein
MKIKCKNCNLVSIIEKPNFEVSFCLAHCVSCDGKTIHYIVESI